MMSDDRQQWELLKAFLRLTGALPKGGFHALYNGHSMDPYDNLGFFNAAEQLTAIFFAHLRFETFPSQLLKLPNLKTLDLFEIELDHPQSMLRLVSQLSQLESLTIDYEYLVQFPDYSALTSLEQLYLTTATLTDAVVATLQKLPALKYLAIHNTGTKAFVALPAKFTTLQQLEELNLTASMLHDVSLAFQLPKLLKLNLSSLTGVTMGKIPPGPLQWLIMSNTELSQLPSSVGNLTHLEKLYVDHCKLGQLPSSIGQLQDLEELSAEANSLQTLPDSLYTLPKLRYLNLSTCRLSKLDPAICQLQALEILYVNNNRDLLVPPCITSLPNLELYRY